MTIYRYCAGTHECLYCVTSTVHQSDRVLSVSHPQCVPPRWTTLWKPTTRVAYSQFGGAPTVHLNSTPAPHGGKLLLGKRQSNSHLSHTSKRLTTLPDVGSPLVKNHIISIWMTTYGLETFGLVFIQQSWQKMVPWTFGDEYLKYAATVQLIVFYIRWSATLFF